RVLRAGRGALARRGPGPVHDPPGAARRRRRGPQRHLGRARQRRGVRRRAGRVAAPTILAGMLAPTVERYLRLGLQLGRHVDGVVDAYVGPPGLAEAVETAPPVEPRRLVADADALLDDLEDGWLRDQVAALRTYAGVLAGEHRSYADEVEGCYGVRPR